jgi:hypothetical protein
VAALTAGRSAAGAALFRKLMDRMEHSSPRAALIYLHGSDERQRVIADSVSKLAERELRGRKSGRPKSDRTQRARRGE